ncbi:MAG: KamA family radical SAM protein [Nanoarchaeota archaeon]
MRKISAKWNDWRWQLKNRAKTLADFEKAGIVLTEDEVSVLQGLQLRTAVTPYYLSLISRGHDIYNPLRKRAIPTIAETNTNWGMRDPLHEDTEGKGMQIFTHRYPDRIAAYVTDQCATYCRHCTRRRKSGETDKPMSQDQIEFMIEYVAKTPKVRDVLLTGGDPLTMSTDRLAKIVEPLRKINHVEIIRIGSAAPVTFPMRINQNLVNMMKEYGVRPLNTHFIHPYEVTPEAVEALDRLVNNGITVYNQTPLLADVNNCVPVLMKLFQTLAFHGVSPYYLFQADQVQGTAHFACSVDALVNAYNGLQGVTTGFAVPRAMIDVPGGGGKTPIANITSKVGNITTLVNFEGKSFQYEEPNLAPGLNNPQTCNYLTKKCNICREN